MALLLVSCGETQSATTDAAATADLGPEDAASTGDAADSGDDVSAADVAHGDSAVGDAGPEEDTGEAPGDATDTGDVTPGVKAFALEWPIFDPPPDPLGEGTVSCPVYLEERCQDGKLARCEIYDTGAAAFDDEPDPMLRRAYLYDRWYDLYSSPDGQTAERTFKTAMPAGTPESVWSDPENFAQWVGEGDSAIWTGTALTAYILRYLHTGTEADYQRMEEKTRVMLRFFLVTGIPGYLARHHYLLVPEGTPNTPDHIFRYSKDSDDHRDIPNPESLDFLPELYKSGLGTPRWSGDPSIDQMNGPMETFPMVYGLLRDEQLKADIAEQMVCYLHSLRRIEIRNLKKNQEALDSFKQFFAGDAVNLDPDDIDLQDLDQIVMYVHPQINASNEDTYDGSCKEFIQMEPWRVLDAASDSFLIDALLLFQDMARTENRPQQVNHFYIPSIRGGDAAHMMHLTLMAYAFTGNEKYVEFMNEELLGKLKTAEVAATMSSLILPKFCRRFYGTNIIAGPLWALNNLLGESPLGTWMQEVMRDEMWEKECSFIGNINFNLMFAGTVSPAIGGAARQEALDYALANLSTFGGNGGILEDPRRTYAKSFEEVVAEMPEGTVPQCMTVEERDFCEREVVVFGVTVPGEKVAFDCTGAPSECVMDDGKCTTAVASEPLPGPLRRWADYTWQRSPFDIGETRANGITQSPGTDYAEQYWMARFYGFIPGAPAVLAWRPSEASCSE